MGPLRLALLALWVAAGCVSTSNPYGVTAATGSHVRPSTASAGAGAATGSSGGGTTGGGSSSSTGGTSGTTGSACAPPAGGCPDAGYRSPLTDCDAGQYEVYARFVDLITQKPPACPGQVIDNRLQDIAADTDSCGDVFLCIAPGTTLNLKGEFAGYADVNLPTIAPTASAQLLTNIELVQNNLLTLFSTTVPDLPQAIDLSLSTLVVRLGHAPGGGPCATQSEQANWTFTLEAADGGAIDAPLIYQEAVSSFATASATTAQGVALFYNIQPAWSSVTVNGTQPGNALPDGGFICPCVDDVPPLPLTGSVLVTAGATSFYPWLLP